MKLKLFTFFFLLTGFGYVLQSLELDSKECKQNYGDENHFVIISTDNAVNITFHFDKTFETLIAYNQFVFHAELYTQALPLSFLKEPSLPDKIYLRQLSLLI